MEDSQDYNIETQVISVMPFEVFRVSNNPNWMIRFKDGVIQKINEECAIGGKNETGGVFVGICNYKTKTIHVVDSISAPIDSKANPIHFVRGHKGLSEEITKFKHNSGDQIGYIGEWHSHPEGPNALSQQDMGSVNNHKTEFTELNPPLPVFLSIITPDGLFPFVF